MDSTTSVTVLFRSTYFVWFVSIPLLYLLLCNILGHFFDEQLKTRAGTPVKCMISFQLVSVCCCFYISMAGAVLHFRLFGVDDLYDILRRDSIYSQSVFVENHLIIPMLVYQIWNTFACFYLNDLRVIEFIMHHVLVALIQGVALAPFLQYHAFFFIGYTELSNVALTYLDTCKSLPSLRERFPRMYRLVQFVFAMLFVVVRLIIWPIRTLPVCYHLFILLIDDKVHSPFVVISFLLSVVVLTTLQFAWGQKVINIGLRTIYSK